MHIQRELGYPDPSIFSWRPRKSVFGVSDPVRHKPGCTVTEAGQRLEILNLEGKGIVKRYLCSENKGAGHLCGYRIADLRLCFRICKNLLLFLRRGSFGN